jgi:hypothetical protein
MEPVPEAVPILRVIVVVLALAPILSLVAPTE